MSENVNNCNQPTNDSNAKSLAENEKELFVCSPALKSRYGSWFIDTLLVLFCACYFHFYWLIYIFVPIAILGVWITRREYRKTFFRITSKRILIKRHDFISVPDNMAEGCS